MSKAIHVLGTTLQPQGKEPGQKDTTKNHGRLGSIRQTPGYLQKQPCHLPEYTGVQLLYAATYDIRCRDVDTDQRNTEQTCGRTDQMERSILNITYEDRKTWVRDRTKFIDIINTVRKNEMVLGRAYQLPQRRPMDLACHHSETM